MIRSTNRPVRSARAAEALLAALALCACSFMTDAATRLARDVAHEAEALRDSPDEERIFEHVPISSPEGCGGAYTVKFHESRPPFHGSLLVGCKGEESFDRYGYSYGTTYHLNAVQVPAELFVEKPAGTPLRVTLRKNGSAIEVVRIE